MRPRGSNFIDLGLLHGPRQHSTTASSAPARTHVRIWWPVHRPRVHALATALSGHSPSLASSHASSHARKFTCALSERRLCLERAGMVPQECLKLGERYVAPALHGPGYVRYRTDYFAWPRVTLNA